MFTLTERGRLALRTVGRRRAWAADPAHTGNGCARRGDSRPCRPASRSRPSTTPWRCCACSRPPRGGRDADRHRTAH